MIHQKKMQFTNNYPILKKGKTEWKVMNERADHQHQFARKKFMLLENIIEVDSLDISVGSFYTILSEKLKLIKVSAWWVPKLCPDQQQTRAELSLEILNKWDQNQKYFLKPTVIGDETWLYQYDPENKSQSKQWQWSKVKASWSGERLCWLLSGMLREFLLVNFSEGKKTVTSAYYANVFIKWAKQLV